VASSGVPLSPEPNERIARAAKGISRVVRPWYPEPVMAASGKEQIARAEAQSASLARELRLGDLVFLQVLLIVGLPWIGYAAKAGGAHIWLWLAAIPLFYLPLAATVIYLSRRMPLEGGVYQWVKIGISPAAGFQAGWNYAFLFILFYANSGSVVANSISYLLGPRYQWMNENKPLLIALNAAFFALVFLVNVRGLHLARWFTGAGGALIISLYLLVIALFVAAPQPVAGFAWPAMTLATLNLFTKIAFNALSGFEQVAIFAGECHMPERNIARSVWIAGPGIALLYILGTCGMLAYVPREQADLIAPVPQILGVALHSSPLAAALGGASILALVFAYFTQTVACIAQVSRLPMVAGWDGLFPARFSALHPKYRTPVRSLAAVSVICVILGAASLGQVGEQEANQILIAAAMACSGIYYLAMFAVVARQRGAPPWLRVSVFASAAVTIAAVVMDAVPVLDVAHPLLFAAKVVGVVLALNATGVWAYRRAAAREDASGRRETLRARDGA
jgi:amino acid transporter